jgi:hypothetical protein
MFETFALSTGKASVAVFAKGSIVADRPGPIRWRP